MALLNSPSSNPLYGPEIVSLALLEVILAQDSQVTKPEIATFQALSKGVYDLSIYIIKSRLLCVCVRSGRCPYIPKKCLKIPPYRDTFGYKDKNPAYRDIDLRVCVCNEGIDS